MTAIMVVNMTIQDDSWIEPYFAEVPAILAAHGARALAGSRRVKLLEGEGVAPDRAAVFEFPSLAAVDQFMSDPRYQPFRRAREAGARSTIVVFENKVAGRAIV